MSVVPKDREERHRWMAMLLRASIAFQVRTMRLARDWTQEELAKRAGLSIPTISRVEDLSGEAPTLETLLTLAKTFDCGLICRFQSWDEFVSHMAGMIPPDPWETEAGAMPSEERTP